MKPVSVVLSLAMALALIVGAPSPGQAQPGPMMATPPVNPIAGYMRDRALDFIDILRLKFHAGSFGVAARATTIAQIGLVYTDGPAFGLERRAFGSWWESRFAAGISAAYTTSINTHYAWGNEFADPMGAWNQMFHRGYIRSGDYWDDGRDRPLSIGAEAHFLIGVDGAVYPEEIADFILGIFTIDILEDDLMWVSGDPLWNQPPPPGPLPMY